MKGEPKNLLKYCVFWVELSQEQNQEMISPLNRLILNENYNFYQGKLFNLKKEIIFYWI